MKLTREHLLTGLVGAVLLAGVAWFFANSEWVDEEVRDPPKGALRDDPDLRLKRLLTRLGATVSAPDSLDRLPPPGATLLLTSWHWNLFPERAKALQGWVESGGHLVVPNFGSFGTGEQGLDWVPIRWVPRKTRAAAAPASQASGGDSDSDTEDHEGDHDHDHEDADTDPESDEDQPTPDEHPADSPAAKAEQKKRDAEAARCPGVNEPAAVTPAFGSVPRGFDFCPYQDGTLATDAPLLWALDTRRGHVFVRVQVGRGTVTASSTSLAPAWGNEQLLERDHALLAAATLQVQAGHEVWLVTNEKRPPLLAFLWQAGAPAVLLLGAALAFGLWRGALRFGPQRALAPLARRSVAEQIRGTAQFIAHHGGAALHAAQLRALSQVARSRVAGFDTMIVGERATAIASATGLDAHALARAMNPALDAALSRHPAAALALLETARRRLLNGTPRAAATAPSPDPR